MSLFLFGISMGEIILIFLVVLMLFGSKKIPDLARSFGKGMNEFRKATEDIKREFEQSTSEIKEELSQIETNIRQNSNEIRDMAEETYRDDYGAQTSVADDIYGLNKPEPSASDVEVVVDNIESKKEESESGSEQAPNK